MRFQRLFVLLAALWLVGPWPASAEPFEVMIPQGVYSADTVFGPFQAPTGGGFLFLDVDSLTGTTPTYRLCIAAVEMNTGGTFPDTRVDCNTAVATTGHLAIAFGGVGVTTGGSSIITNNSVSVWLPLRWFMLLDLEGTSPVWTGEASIAYAWQTP